MASIKRIDEIIEVIKCTKEDRMSDLPWVVGSDFSSMLCGL